MACFVRDETETDAETERQGSWMRGRPGAESAAAATETATAATEKRTRGTEDAARARVAVSMGERRAVDVGKRPAGARRIARRNQSTRAAQHTVAPDDIRELGSIQRKREAQDVEARALERDAVVQARARPRSRPADVRFCSRTKRPVSFVGKRAPRTTSASASPPTCTPSGSSSRSEMPIVTVSPTSPPSTVTADDRERRPGRCRPSLRRAPRPPPAATPATAKPTPATTRPPRSDGQRECVVACGPRPARDDGSGDEGRGPGEEARALPPAASRERASAPPADGDAADDEHRDQDQRERRHGPRNATRARPAARQAHAPGSILPRAASGTRHAATAQDPPPSSSRAAVGAPVAAPTASPRRRSRQRRRARA